MKFEEIPQPAEVCDNAQLVTAIYNKVVVLNLQVKQMAYNAEMMNTPGVLEGVNIMTEATLNLLNQSLKGDSSEPKSIIITRPKP